ncbi:MAG: hypothetical protein AAF559_12175 [Pseudomonadota bacterium]
MATIDDDGMPVANEGLTGAFSLWDVPRIEAQRGPQATVQGRNALAGAIILQTEDPQYDLDAAARVLVGKEESFFSGSNTILDGPAMTDPAAPDYDPSSLISFDGRAQLEREFRCLIPRERRLVRIDQRQSRRLPVFPPGELRSRCH